MLSIRKAHPALRVLAMTVICSLCLVWFGAIQQRSNAIAGSLLLGAAGAAAAGSVLPVVIGGTLLLALGVAFIDRDALITAAGRLGAALGDLFDRDMAASTVVQEPVTGRYKLKTHIGDDTWSAARSWVAQQYDPGEVTGSSTTVSLSSSDLTTDYICVYSVEDGINLMPCTHIYPVGGTMWTMVYSIVDGDLWCRYVKNGSQVNFSKEKSDVSYVGFRKFNAQVDYWRIDTVDTGCDHGSYQYSAPGAVVGTAAPDIVDNTTYDYRNARSGAREIVVPLVAAGAAVEMPDVSIEGDDTRKWVVPDVGIDNLVGAHPADVPAQDVGGVQVDEGVQVDSGAKTDAQTAIDAAAADETQSSLAGLFFSKFPFCIPFDVLQAFKLIAAPAVAPRFEWDGLSTCTLPIEWHGSTKIVFDMHEERWQVVGQICRWTSLVGFCLALMLGTRRLMKW